MEIIKIWRGNSKADGEFCRVVDEFLAEQEDEDEEDD